MYAKLSDEGIAGRISRCRVQDPEFCSGVFHKVDALDSMYCCVSTSFDKALISSLEECFFNVSITNYHEPSHDEKSSDS